jgi:tRNA-specific 2-thiouridylase
MARVVLAMSGGVDSSVAAHLLRENGHDVIGVFMRHGEASPATCSADANPQASSLLPVVATRLDHKQGCCTAADAEDARRVADRLEIPFYALDFHEEFGRIIDYFVEEYAAARTPNPCVMCNNWLKFGKLFDFADSVGAEFVATGHYAGIERSGFRVQGSGGPGHSLLRGLDPSKDQSYVLFGIERKFLSRMLLPVGHYQKHEIRAIAARIGLRVADKRDSQEICFVTSGHHAEFVRRRLSVGADDGATAGEVVSTAGDRSANAKVWASPLASHDMWYGLRPIRGES